MIAYHDSLKQLASCLIASNRHKEAEDLVKKHINGENEKELRYYLGLNHAVQGNIDEAIKELKVVLEKERDYETAKNLTFKLLIHQASLKIKEKDWKGISSALTMALELAPGTPDAKKELFRFKNAVPISYIKAGKREEAARIWEEELKKDPTNPRIIHNLALLYYWWAVKEEKENNKVDGNEASRIDRLWKKTIAYWVMLMNVEGFWQEWKKEREDMCSFNIKEEDISELKSSLIENKLVKVFHDYIDRYKKDGSEKNSLRHEEYLKTLFLERQSARCWKDALNIWKDTFDIKIDTGIKRYDMVRAIQRLDGNSTCFATVKSCSKIDKCTWGRYCLSDRNRELFFNIPAGYQLFHELDMHLEAYKLIEFLHKSKPDNDLLGRLRIYLSPARLGWILVLLEERKNPQQAINEWKRLPENITDNSVSNGSVEGRYVYALALTEKGKKLSEKGDTYMALGDWSTARKYIAETIKSTSDRSFDKFLTSLNAEIGEAVIKTCEKKAKRLKQEDKLNEAITILEKGLKIVDNKSLKEHIAVFYCDRGTKKLEDKNFPAARNDFEKALSYDSNNKRAKQSIGTTYNNEGVDTKDVDKAIGLFRKAISYDPDSEVVKNNLAGALNGKAVNILNALSEYSSSSKCDNAIGLLKEGIKLLNPSIKLDSSFLDGLAYTEEWGFDDLVKNLADDLYKTMLKNLWGACRNRKILRGY